MPNYFTMLWSKDSCNFIARTGEVGNPLTYIWGGYNLATNFNHYKISPNDCIYPLAIRNFNLYLIGRMEVCDCLSLSTFQNLFPIQSKESYHSCADQVLTGNEGTLIQLDRQVPAPIVENLNFVSGKSYRKPKYIEAGKIMNISSFQGIFKLSPDSAINFDKLLDE